MTNHFPHSHFVHVWFKKMYELMTMLNMSQFPLRRLGFLQNIGRLAVLSNARNDSGNFRYQKPACFMKKMQTYAIVHHICSHSIHQKQLFKCSDIELQQMQIETFAGLLSFLSSRTLSNSKLPQQLLQSNIMVHTCTYLQISLLLDCGLVQDFVH